MNQRDYIVRPAIFAPWLLRAIAIAQRLTFLSPLPVLRGRVRVWVECQRIPKGDCPASLLSIIALIAADQYTVWYLATLPFIWLGSICAQPNLNLADGCLAYVAMIVGLVTIAFYKPLGAATLFGTMSGLYLSCIEKIMRMRPAPDN